MERHAVREVPDERARFRVAERMAAVVLHRDADDAARQVGLPVLAFGRLLLGVGELVPPAELLHEHRVELGIAGRDVAAERMRAVASEQVHAVALDTEVGAEAAAAVHDVLAVVVEVRRAGVLELGRPVARPRQAEVVAVAGAALGLQRAHVERAHVLHVELEPLGRLPGVADREAAAIDLAQDRFRLRLFPSVARILHHLVVLVELLVEAELLREGRHDHVIGLRLEQRLDHLLAPLQRAARRSHRSGGLELRASRAGRYAPSLRASDAIAAVADG